MPLVFPAAHYPHGGRPRPTSQQVVFLTSGSSWTVPENWTDDVNEIHCIGGGATSVYVDQGGPMGSIPSNGGGGGAYCKTVNVVLEPGAAIGYAVGGIGGHTHFRDGSTCYAGGAQGSTGGVPYAANALAHYGGNGGTTLGVHGMNSGGGGAAGPYNHGGGGAGGTNAEVDWIYGGGGGGGGGSAQPGGQGYNSPGIGYYGTAGSGGHNPWGYGGGAGGYGAGGLPPGGDGGPAGDGVDGGGGGAPGQSTQAPNERAGNGGNGIEFGSGVGSGGGGGAVSSSQVDVGYPGHGGFYGGGGGSCWALFDRYGVGRQGIICIKWGP
jgi:hypothetical protein